MMIDHLTPPRTRPPSPRPLYWVCQAAGWSVFGGYVTISYLFSTGGRWTGKDIFNIVLFTMMVCPLLTHGLRSMFWRRGWIGLLSRRLLPRLATVVVLSAVTLVALTATGLFLLHGPPWLPPFAMASMTVGYSTALSGWIYIYFAVHASRRHHEMRAAMHEAQLQALTAQLNPHFLFNCLNSIRALIMERPAQAASMVTGLADLLRYSLAADRRQTVPLAEELAVVDDYISLERMRFEDRLRTEWTVAPAALTARLPPMLVQTLVENAVKHGIADSKAGGSVSLRATVEGERLEIEVTNTGAFKAPTDGNGRGLRNAAERLRLIYGVSASLNVRASGGGTVASLSLPLETPT